MTNQIQKQFKKQKNMRKITLLMLLAFVAMFTNAQISRYVKVSTTGTGDGTSWENAAGTADIQTQINAVAAETNQGTVYFAAGTYLISAQIQLKNNVQLMGGYAADGSGTRDLLNNQLFWTVSLTKEFCTPVMHHLMWPSLKSPKLMDLFCNVDPVPMVLQLPSVLALY
jgi:hypothetical protein